MIPGVIPAYSWPLPVLSEWCSASEHWMSFLLCNPYRWHSQNLCKTWKGKSKIMTKCCWPSNQPVFLVDHIEAGVLARAVLVLNILNLPALLISTFSKHIHAYPPPQPLYVLISETNKIKNNIKILLSLTFHYAHYNETQTKQWVLGWCYQTL